MRRHIATFVQISEQGLFFSLALLLTLLAGQLHHNWQVAYDARAIASRPALVVRMPAPMATVLRPVRPEATAAATRVEVPVPRERWVF